MDNIINLHENNRARNKQRVSLREGAKYLGMSYAQLRKITVELNLIPYRNDGLGHYQKPSILIEDLDKYDRENIVLARKEA